MIWIILVGIVIFLFVKFGSDMNKDNDDLSHQNLEATLPLMVKG